MTTSEISVIIPTYNRRPEIFSRAFDSVLKQTLLPKEIVVVDSGDVEEYSNSIKDIVESASVDGVDVRYVRFEKRLNGSEARNLGASYCSGSLYCFLDDDDEWYPDKLESQVSLFTDDVGLVSSNYDLESEGKTFYEFCRRRDPNKEILGENCLGCTSMAMISASIFEELNGFDPKMRSNQEWDLWIRTSKKTKIIQNDEKVGIKHDLNDSISDFKIAVFKGGFRLIIKNAGSYLKHPRLLIKSSYLLLLNLLN